MAAHRGRPERVVPELVSRERRGGDEVEVDVDGRRLRLTNLRKLLYPEAGTTKAHVLDYYARIAPVLLPHLHGRAMTLKRYPDGVAGPHFYDKHCAGRPPWVDTLPMWSERKREDAPRASRSTSR